MNNFAFFEVPADREQEVIPALDGTRYRSHTLEVELAKPKPASESRYERPRKSRFNKSKSNGSGGRSSRGRGKFPKGSGKNSSKNRSSRFSY